ncbi:sugar ABC transporter permease [Psychrobacillus sp. FSL H8-0484]|uniref:ABC transporter permease subunit n=1 Tax=Psychrobacillus sp. FSL H8-0484 TaxID=2921390 RepID=UPI0030FD1AE4
MYQIMKVRELSIILLMIVYFVFVGSINSQFTDIDSIILIVNGSVILLVMAIGQSFVLLTSNIDVSVGSILGLSAAVCGTLLASGANLGVVVFSVICIGAVIGFVNGMGVSYLKIPAIIMTLGMLGVVRGLMLLYTKGMWIENIPNYYKKIARMEMLGVPYPVWIGAFLVFISYLFLSKTKFGRYFYAVGDNTDGAQLVGLPVNVVKVLAFILSGISASIASLIFVMNIGFVSNQTGSGIELQVIAAAVLGGVALTGGVGSVVGAGLGAIFFTVINSSLVFMKIPAYWNSAISGLLLIVIVVGDSRFQKYLNERSSKNPKNSLEETEREKQTKAIT